MLLRWRNVVEGLFEIGRTEGDATILLNLIDDLDYRVYSNTGQTVGSLMPDVAFVGARLVPLTDDSWVISGVLQAMSRTAAPMVAEIAIELSAKHPALVFRNPEKVELGWERMHRDRGRFIEYFGTDEVVLSPADAEIRMNVYLRRRQRAAHPGQVRPFALAGTLFEHDTVGIIYDETDGLMFLPGYGTLRELFEDPRLAADEEHVEALRGYLNSDSIRPAPLPRLAAAYPRNADAVFAKVLGKRTFSWAEQGEALLRKRKPWYFEHEPLPCVSVIGADASAAARRSAGRVTRIPPRRGRRLPLAGRPPVVRRSTDATRPR
jgi:hypothetical protein